MSGSGGVAWDRVSLRDEVVAVEVDAAAASSRAWLGTTLSVGGVVDSGEMLAASPSVVDFLPYPHNESALAEATPPNAMGAVRYLAVTPTVDEEVRPFPMPRRRVLSCRPFPNDRVGTYNYRGEVSASLPSTVVDSLRKSSSLRLPLLP